MGFVLFLISTALIFAVFLYCKVQASAGRAEGKIRAALLGLLVVIACIWGWYFLSVKPANEHLTEAGQIDNCRSRLHAYYASQEFVKQRLKSPQSASFPADGEVTIVQTRQCRFMVDSYVEAKNPFGVVLKKRYSADLEFLPDAKEWRLNSIDIQ